MRTQMLASKPLDAPASNATALRRVLGPVALVAVGVGATVGARLFVMLGRVAALEAGPAVVISLAVAAAGCALAALCYAELVSQLPSAGGAYAYAHAALGELAGWATGWVLLLEYGLGAACVAAAWSPAFNAVLGLADTRLPDDFAADPFSTAGASFGNAPAVLLMTFLTILLVVGTRAAARANAILVAVTVGAVVLTLAAGALHVNPDNWTKIRAEERRTPAEKIIPGVVRKYVKEIEQLEGAIGRRQVQILSDMTLTQSRKDRLPGSQQRRAGGEDTRNITAEQLQSIARADSERTSGESWGLLGFLGVHRVAASVDERMRNAFAPYGLSGIVLGVALLFLALTGFDSVATLAEEAHRPVRDVPLALLAALGLATVLGLLTAAVLTGIEPYYTLETENGAAAVFRKLADKDQSAAPRWTAGLIAVGTLAGTTSMALALFLSQTRILWAMARDGLFPVRLFGAVDPGFGTPHAATLAVGAVVGVAAAFTPVQQLESLAGLGALLAFFSVCAAALLLRMRRPEAARPFRCPALFVVAPLGMAVSLGVALFLSVQTWMWLGLWLLAGLVVYGVRGRRRHGASLAIPNT